jgi:hypothetical protein
MQTQVGPPINPQDTGDLIGHPGIPDPNPDEVTPDDPDYVDPDPQATDPGDD